MKSTRFLAALATLLIAGSTLFAQATDYRQIATPQLRSFSMPQPTRIVLGNGMVVFLQEDHELPLVRGSATIRGGGRDVPATKAGLIDVYAEAWRTGGTATRNGDELDRLLEARAARVETDGDIDSTAVTFDVMKGDLDTVFPIFVDLLRNPAFRQEKIDLAKTQLNTVISRRNDEPGDILAREAAKLGYGANSPYARQTEYATVASITREDLLAFHQRTVHPNNIILAIFGDFDAKKMEKRLRDTFGSWKKGPQISRPDPAIAAAKPGVYYIEKEGVTQANIALVHPGVERNHPDYYALAVMNEIFSGGFSGRLMQRLRSERGLTYGVGGGVGANWDYPGLFRVQMATKSGSTLESIEALRTEIGKLVTESVTDKELSLSKESILNAFVFTMDTREKALNQQVLLEFYGFPADYFRKYPANIEKVTAADIQRAAKAHVHPDQLALLVVGVQKEFEKPLSTLGIVTPIDITIPTGDTGEKKPATTNEAGRALVGKVLDFVGGAAAVNEVKALRQTGSMTVKTPQGEMAMELVSVVQYPSSERRVMKTPMGEITQVFTPEAAFMLTPMGNQDIPGSQRDAARAQMKVDVLTVLRHVDDPKYAFSAAGTEKVGDVEAQLLEIDAEGTRVRWVIDPASGRILRSITRMTGPVSGDMVTEYTEWKKVGSVNMPTAAVQMLNGEKMGAVTFTNIELNPTVDPKEFVKP